MSLSGREEPNGLKLSLPAARFRLIGDDVWQDVLVERYGPFFGRTFRDTREIRVALEVTEDPRSDPDRLFQLMTERGQVSRTDGVLMLETPSSRVSIDLDRCRGRIEGPLCRTSVDHLVRHTLPEVLAGDGLVVHGALVASGSRSWICAGPSGCGKSTLAALVPDRRFCDDLCVARFDGSRWRAEALPFWHGRPLSARLEGVYLLRHGDEHRRHRLPAGESVRRLAREVLWPSDGSPVLGASWEALLGLVEEVPVSELEFRPDADVWTVLSEAA